MYDYRTQVNSKVKLTYNQLEDIFYGINKHGDEPITGYVVFTKDSFTKPYPELSRTYAVSSDNKAYKPNMNGYSIFGSCLDESDQNIRLDMYMRDLTHPWKVEFCYIDIDDYIKFKKYVKR